MALQEYVGAIVLEVDGKEVECSSFSPHETTGRRPVRTMNRQGRVMGYCEGTASYDLAVSLPIPVDGNEPDWGRVTGAKLVIYPASGKGKRTAYTDCVVMEVGECYEAEGEARRDLTLFATNKVKE